MQGVVFRETVAAVKGVTHIFDFLAGINGTQIFGICFTGIQFREIADIDVVQLVPVFFFHQFKVGADGTVDAVALVALKPEPQIGKSGCTDDGSRHEYGKQPLIEPRRLFQAFLARAQMIFRYFTSHAVGTVLSERIDTI